MPCHRRGHDHVANDDDDDDEDDHDDDDDDDDDDEDDISRGANVMGTLSGKHALIMRILQATCVRRSPY